MFDTIKNALTTIAPTIAGALGGPLAAAGVTALESVFGLKNATPDQLQQAVITMTPDQAIALKKMDQDFQIALKQAANDQLKIYDQNIDNAREREIELARIDPKANWPLYFIIYCVGIMLILTNVSCFFTTVFSETAKNIDILCIGSVVTYLFGMQK